MGVEAGHVQITEFSKEVIPQINWMIEDLFCRYGVAMPYFLLDFDFPDYSGRPDWITYSPEWPSMYWPAWAPAEWKEYWPSFLTQWPDWLPTNGFSFGSDWGKWGYWLTWFNELMGLLFDEADLPRWQMPDFSEGSIDMLNSKISELYDSVIRELTPVGETDIRCIRRAGYSDTYANAKTEYEDDPRYCASYSVAHEIYTTWHVARLGSGSIQYQIAAYQGYGKFDTRTVTSVRTAKFVLAVDAVTLTNVTENPTLYIYKHDFGDTLECADWSGGTKLTAERAFTSADNGEEVEIEIATGDVVTEDYSRYRFTLQKIDEEDYWPEPDPEGQKAHSIACDTIKLVLT